MDRYYLNNGESIPCIGFGTFPMKGVELVSAVWSGVNNGYLMFDTASAYKNEIELGLAFKKFNKKQRSSFFVSTKISNRQQEIRNVRACLERSLKKLGLKYMDMYMLHWPLPDYYIDTWKQMEDLHDEGLIKSLGVCNFHQHHLEKLLDKCRIKPVVNQIELHPLLSQKDLRKFCCENDILVEAYSPIARMDELILRNSVLNNIAEKYMKSIVQVILRWDYQNKIIPIIKSSNKKRIKDNINIFDFELSEEEVELIENLNVNYRVRHNPDDCDYSKI